MKKEKKTQIKRQGRKSRQGNIIKTRNDWKMGDNKRHTRKLKKKRKKAKEGSKKTRIKRT